MQREVEMIVKLLCFVKIVKSNKSIFRV